MNPSTMQQISSSTGDNNDGVGGVDLYQCSKCETMLGRHRFPKKIFRKLILDNNNNNNNNNNDRPEHDVKLYPDPWTGQPWGW